MRLDARMCPETETRNAMPPPPLGSDLDAAFTVASLGKDTRPSRKLKGMDGKPVVIPKMEETMYLLYLEVALMRKLFMLRVEQGRR